jgi:hypothetical protein
MFRSPHDLRRSGLTLSASSLVGDRINRVHALLARLRLGRVMRIEGRIVAWVALFMCVAGAIRAQDRPGLTGLALTPPMGFNTWNKFGCDVSEQLVREWPMSC